MEVTYQKTKCLNFSDKLEITLFAVFMQLNKKYGVTYMSYTFDRFDSVRYSFRSDQKWASIYNEKAIGGKSIIEQCPLDIVSRERRNKFIIWDHYIHKSQPLIYQDIMDMRKNIGLRHGLTLSAYFNGHHDAIAVATEDKKNDLAMKLLLKEGTHALQKYLFSCREQSVKFIKINLGKSVAHE